MLFGIFAIVLFFHWVLVLLVRLTEIVQAIKSGSQDPLLTGRSDPILVEAMHENVITIHQHRPVPLLPRQRQCDARKPLSRVGALFHENDDD